MVEFVQTDEYLRLFKEICEQLDTALDRERIAIAILHEVAKDKRMAMIMRERENGKQEQATVRQIAYLHVLGIEPNNGLTKTEATHLIEEALAKRNTSR